MNDKKNILILSSLCIDNASANGICGLNIKDAISSYGSEAHIMGYSVNNTEITDYNNIHSIGMYNPFASYGKLERYWISVYNCFKPFTDKELIKKYTERAIKLIKDKHFTSIIVMYYPLELLIVAKTIRKEFPNIEMILFELDSKTDGLHGGQRLERIQNISYIRWMKKQYKTFDKLIILESHAEHVKKVYKNHLPKSVNIVDLPMLVLNHERRVSKNNKSIQFFYTGILNSRYRSPVYLLQCIEKMNEHKDYIFEFYSYGDCEEIIKRYSEADNRIKQHGQIDKKLLNEKMQDADFLINIGNINSNSVPSKLIDYVSRAKPIIHFCYSTNDICLRYLSKYPLSCIVNMSDNIHLSVNKIVSFVQENLGKKVDESIILSNFQECTPEYCIKYIL